MDDTEDLSEAVEDMTIDDELENESEDESALETVTIDLDNDVENEPAIGTMNQDATDAQENESSDAMDIDADDEPENGPALDGLTRYTLLVKHNPWSKPIAPPNIDSSEDYILKWVEDWLSCRGFGEPTNNFFETLGMLDLDILYINMFDSDLSDPSVRERKYRYMKNELKSLCYIWTIFAKMLVTEMIYGNSKRTYKIKFILQKHFHENETWPDYPKPFPMEFFKDLVV